MVSKSKEDHQPAKDEKHAEITDEGDNKDDNIAQNNGQNRRRQREVRWFRVGAVDHSERHHLR